MESKLKYDFSKLNRFARGISEKMTVKVGIFAAKSARKDGGLTNADVGLAHEIGSPSRGLPIRSWLRMPLVHESGAIIKEMGKDSLELIAKGDTKPVLQKLGFAAENAIDRAFGSGGFGLWPQDAYSTIMRKLKKKFSSVEIRRQLTAQVREEGAGGINAILIDTAQLRRSVASKVG